MTAIDVLMVPINTNLLQFKMHYIEIHENIPKLKSNLVANATRG